MSSVRRTLLPLSMLLLAASAATTVAQEPVYDDRAELQQRLDSLRSASGGSDVRRRIEVIETRLRRGDFQAGDMIQLRVARVDTLTGQYRVDSQQVLELPTIEGVPLNGVLYSEADSVIREALSVYVRDPRIEVRPLRRVAVLGGVNSPGFYDVPPSTTISEALMRAGGPSSEAEVDDLEYRRNGRNLLEGRREIYQLVLADLGPGREDEIYVPVSSGGFSFMGALGVVSAVAGTAWAITRVF